jgi:hypothetical protein
MKSQCEESLHTLWLKTYNPQNSFKGETIM